ncbi:squalene/phytoene synthase family protein [Sphingomonas desiccabilis]|uniref:Phytoene synthase n=1 Tax=Sphingomonas desiccabilis TaxID=429134 RepID=A0A4Q2J100_9SPHN|nr:squalene/phytoene synthase family protein [Sphingomonas desiccabilis]MBB3910890.1 phytoene synthase [Sphingomonas desiccabilis]RXZ35488.1 hypothetical protein EO081_07690 [Sphingomonas desiccabilis]
MESAQPAGQQQEGQAERHLALTYVPARHRPAIVALFALDDALADIVRTTSEPAIGQMRLVWWHDALVKLDTAPPPAQPVLQAIARDLLPSGARGSDAAAMIDGWDVLIEEPELDRATLQRFGAGRGGTLFGLAARALDPAAPLEAVRAAGSGWALADLAGGLSSPQEAEAARALALEQLRGALEQRWPRALRPLGMLAHFARLDIEQVPAGSPKRLARVLWHRLTGR